jgi:hypothetical protein
LLERPTRPDQLGESEEPEPAELAAAAEGTAAEPEPEPSKGRGAPPRKASKPESRPAKVKGRTIYLHDDLFERILVQAHRRGKTISDYVAAVLERQVPDHRLVRADPAENGAA